MKVVRISSEIIDSALELAPLAGLGGGAVASFTGIVRGDANDRGGVTAIELEHYPAMTEGSLSALMDEAFSRWSLLGGVLVHRVGMIAVGKPVVVVGTAASHRAEALEGCAFLIDRLKTDAPFWKKEHRADGSANWVEAKDSDGDRAKRWL